MKQSIQTTAHALIQERLERNETGFKDAVVKSLSLQHPYASKSQIEKVYNASYQSWSDAYCN